MLEFFGHLERLASDLYPWRFLILAIVLVVAAAVLHFAYRRGWHTYVWERRVRFGIIGTPILALLLFIAWDLGSPLFINKTVEEEFPFAFAGVMPEGVAMEDAEMAMEVMSRVDMPAMEAMPSEIMAMTVTTSRYLALKSGVGLRDGGQYLDVEVYRGNELVEGGSVTNRGIAVANGEVLGGQLIYRSNRDRIYLGDALVYPGGVEETISIKPSAGRLPIVNPVTFTDGGVYILNEEIVTGVAFMTTELSGIVEMTPLGPTVFGRRAEDVLEVKNAQGEIVEPRRGLAIMEHVWIDGVKEDILAQPNYVHQISTTDIVTAGPERLKAGMFRDWDRIHKGSGEAVIYRAADGSHLLRLENIDVTNGPDLHVLVSPHPDPRHRDHVKEPGYFSLGPLKGNRGSQNYPIQAEQDPASFGSVIIYCVPFQVIFTIAPLMEG